MFKRIMCLFLALLLVVPLIPVQVRAEKGGKLVALTFDDGPSSKLTPTLLDGLRARGVKVTFFMLGQNAKVNPKILQQAYDDGHEIANHSWNHPDLTGKSLAEAKAQIEDTNKVFDKVCGKGTKYLVRTPYGSSNETVRALLGAPNILWSVDTLDWKYTDAGYVCNKIIQDTYDGAIILCHDIHSTTVSGALQAIDMLLKRGYEFVTVSELFRRRDVKMENGTRYYQCKPNGTDVGAVQAPEITYETVEGGVKITMSSPSGAPIYYCLDGSPITQESKLYTDSIVVSMPINLQAVAAFNLNGGRSEAVSVQMDKLPCSVPELTIDVGVMTLTCNTFGAPVHYTLDGSAPGAGSALYMAPVQLEPGTVVRSVAGGGAYQLSGERVVYYSPMGNVFADVMPGQWFAQTVDTLASMKWMEGTGQYRFEPNGTTTRAMVAMLLYRYHGQPLEQGWIRTNDFGDVADTAWYVEAVEWAMRNGIVSGYPNNTFRPNQPVTRQEMAHMIAGFLTFRGNGLPAGEQCRSKFADGADIGNWALESVSAVVAAGLMEGDENGKLLPCTGATRAQFGTVLLRMMNLEVQMEQEREEQENPEPEPTEPETTEPEVKESETVPTE